MRKSFVVLTMGALCCFCFAPRVNSTSNVAFANGWDFAGARDAQEDDDSDDLLIQFDADFDDDAQEVAASTSEDSEEAPVEFDVNFDDGDDASEDGDSTSEDSADASVESNVEPGDEEKADDSGADVSDGSTTDSVENEEDEGTAFSGALATSDEFAIDEKDVLGSAFDGLIPSTSFVDSASFEFEKDCAVERVGVFSAGVWLKERVEQNKAARETERAKYAGAADAPDEYKTLDDFFATTTGSEREFVDGGKRPGDAAGWFMFARQVAKSGRLEFAKRALEESFLVESGAYDASFLSNEELENDARQSGLDDAYVRLERGAFERLCLASFQYWSDASRFDDAFERSFNGSQSERSSAWTALVRAGDYGAARFCRLSLDKFGDLKTNAQGKVVFDKKSGDLVKTYDAYTRTAASYFERVGFGAPIVALWNADGNAVGAIVDSMKFTRAPYVWAELGLCCYDESRPQALRRSIENALKLQYGKVPSRSQVVIMAYKQARGYYDRSLETPGKTFPETDSKRKTNFGADAKTFIWRWNAQTKEAEPVLVDVEYAYLYEAARLARAADKLATKNRILNKEARSLAIASTGELLVAQVGADYARSALAKFEVACPGLTADELASAVQYAIKAKRCRGALIPMILLGDKGDASLFNTTRTASPVVVQGASCADRRVRYEALRAVVKQNPKQDFNGSRVVQKALQWFASAKGERVVVVLDPSDSSEEIVKRLEGFGFVVRTGKTVHEMLTEVQDEADLEFVYLPDGLDPATLQSAAKALRMEQTTAETPILVGALDDKADVFDLEADKLSGLRFYDSVVPSNASCRLRARQAKCAALALETIQKLKADVLDVSDKKSKQIFEGRNGAGSLTNETPEKKIDSKPKGKVNFK